MTSSSYPPTICDLSIIIVNWNTRDLLANCLDSIYSSSSPLNSEVIVLDCASSDHSPDMIRRQFPQVTLIESETNLGFAAGNNLAIRQAGGNHILLLNPDTLVLDSALARLSAALHNYPGLGIVGAQLLNVDGSFQHSCGQYPSLRTETPLLNRFTHMKRQPYLEALQDQIPSMLAVDWVSGACLMSKREVFENIGLLDEDFWLYTEEADFCYRAQAAGWAVASIPEARVTHIAQAASRQKFTMTLLFFHQSRVRFIAKHHGSFQAKRAKQITATKALMWQQIPNRSPLCRAYGPDLTAKQIRSAYHQLHEAMSMSLEALLSTRWQ